MEQAVDKTRSGSCHRTPAWRNSVSVLDRRSAVGEGKRVAKGLKAMSDNGECQEAWSRGLEDTRCVPSGSGISSHRGCTSKSRTSFRRAWAGTDESLSISASNDTCFFPVRLNEPYLVLDDLGTPSRDQTTASPAQSTSAFLYSALSTIDSTTIALKSASSRVKRPLSD